MSGSHKYFRQNLFSGRIQAVFLVVLFMVALSMAATFTNPIGAGADPWVIQWKGSYYYCGSNGGVNCVVKKAQKLQEIAKAPKVVVWQPPADSAYSQQIWAPELHYLRGKWYIYFAADNGDNFNHRMYVLEGTTQNPQDPFVFKGKLNIPTDRWAIDATVLSRNDTAFYFIWSGWQDTVNDAQHLYIARMRDPLTISSDRVLISSPTYEWERRGGGNGMPYINEGPAVLRHGGALFIIYSASGSWGDDYCLGQLRYMGGDLLNKSSWYKKSTPVFSKTATVFGPGHCSFVKSPDSTEDWIVFHSAKYNGAGWDRNVRIQPFGWKADNTPDFGTPIADGVLLEEPSSNVVNIIVPSQRAEANPDRDFTCLSPYTGFYSALGRSSSALNLQSMAAGVYLRADRFNLPYAPRTTRRVVNTGSGRIRR